MRSLKKRRLLFNLLLIASMIASYLPITLSNTVNAVSAEQRKIFNYTITYFNECGENSGGGSDISSDVADPNEAAAEIFKALTTHNFKHNGNKPLNAVQAAAVLGNLQSESGFNPNLDNGLGYHGLAQWGGGRWDAIPSPKGFKEQVEYLLEEMDNDYYGPALSEFWESSTPDDLAKATFAFVRNYEVAILNGGGPTKWSGHDSACIYLQGWDTCSSMGYANPRWPNAQAQYNLYKDQAPSSSSDVTSSGITGKIIWVGDSRTEGMSSAISNGNNVWIAKTSMGYDWFVSDAIPRTNEELEDGDTIVFNFGVNDLGNVDRYISKLNELVKGDWSKAGQIIVMSVNPVDESKTGSNGYSVTNAQIEEFNQKMQDGLDSTIKYIDVYSQIKDSLGTTDGVHYDNATYQKIYDIIRGSEGSEAGVCDNSSSGNPNVDGYVFPFGVSSGTTTQESLTSWYGTAYPTPGMTMDGGDLCHTSWTDKGICHHGYNESGGNGTDGAVDLTVDEAYMEGTGYQPKGEPYYAIYSGTITSISQRHGNPSCYDVMLKGDDGWIYWYGHGGNWAFQNLTVGQQVKAGDKINEMGIGVCADNTSPHEHIDRGYPKGTGGGVNGKRDPDFPKVMNELFKTLPESQSMIDNFKKFYQNHKKLVRIACIYLFIVIAIAVVVFIASSINQDSSTSIKEEPSQNPSGSNDNTALSVDKDDGAQTELTGLYILNYTVMDKCMFSSERNYVTYAINKALLLNKSTHNNQPLDQQESIDSSSTNADVYPVISGGQYFEATIDDDKITSDNISYECSFNLTTAEGKKISVYFNRYGNRPADYIQVDVNLLN